MLILSVAEVSRGQGGSVCDDIIADWLSKLKPSENPENATLTVHWNNLGQALLEKDCPVDNLSLELWRVEQHSQRPKDFGTQDYFSAFERCNKLEPEHFLFHSTQSYQVNGTDVSFLHTVEKEYMFRVCPCHRRRHRSVSCDCQFDGHMHHSNRGSVKGHFSASRGRPQCSRIFEIEPVETAEVMPWCLTGPALLPHVGKRVEEVSLKSMLMNCTHLLVAGTMASCTPIQSYDHVLLTFHKLENASSQICWEHRDFGTHNPVKVISRLYSQSPFVENFSHGMGDFTAIVGLSADSSYCVQLEHVRHPYCMREITISHSSTYRMPRVCSVHMAKPITTAVCSAPPPQVYTRFNFTHDPVFVATVLALILIVFIAGLCIGRRFCFGRAKASSAHHKGKRTISRLTSAENEPMISKILTVDEGPMAGFGGSLASLRVEHPGTRVFLLHFLLDDDEEARYQLMRQWVKGMADVVYDLEDEEWDEEINLDPEGWVLERLSQPQIRVVLVASRSVTQLLRHSSSPPEVSSASCSTATSTDGGSHSLSDCDIQKAEAGHRASCFLEEEMMSSVDTDKKAEAEGSEEILVPDDLDLDPRRCLRAFALKHVQAHLSGNYRQLTVVSYDKLCSDGELVARSLTPNKGPLVLPHHLSDLQRWVQSGHTASSLVGGGGGRATLTAEYRSSPAIGRGRTLISSRRAAAQESPCQL